MDPKPRAAVEQAHVEVEEQHARPAAPAGSAVALFAVYALAIFSGAFLLFLIQPMFGKMVLPLLGGSPAVWNTCMLFFQLALLAGYLYAHATSRWLPARPQWLLHLLLLGIAFLALPITVGSAAPLGAEAPIPWLLGLMAMAVGPPFVVLAATGPMLQRWFANSPHPEAERPYHLYAASNLGSMLALLTYPFLIEPRLRVAEQTLLWTGAYVGLMLLMAACGAWGWRAPARAAKPGVTLFQPAEGEGLSIADRLWWVALALVPSSLLLGVTTYITTDLTPVPLLWVLPLALYLLSFTLVFARRQLIRHDWMLAVQPAVIAAVVIVLQRTEHLGRPGLAIPLHLFGLFVVAMVAHGELSRRRPPVRHLTEFYLWISVGGALGGVFNVLVAPVVFDRFWEYPLMLVAACLLRPWPRFRMQARTRLVWLLRAVGFGAVLAMLSTRGTDEYPWWLYGSAVVLTIYLVRRILGRTPAYLALAIGIAVLSRFVADVRDERTIFVHRSFYGQFRVNQAGGFTVLQHGSTLHGAQMNDPELRSVPLTYYVREGPVGDIFASLGADREPHRVAIVGLGTGSMAAYAQEGERWSYYELDPGIARVAMDTAYFTYLSDSAGEAEVILGDARLSLERGLGEPLYDVIFLDAFSSDAIPVHLLTREAMLVYLSRLAPGGKVAFHISNRYLRLEPVIAALARDLQMAARISTGPDEVEQGLYRSRSTWVVLTRERYELGLLQVLEGWRDPEAPLDFDPWTDDFSSLWTVMNW